MLHPCFSTAVAATGSIFEGELEGAFAPASWRTQTAASASSLSGPVVCGPARPGENPAAGEQVCL